MEKKIPNLMSKNLLVVDISASLDEAYKILKNNRIRHLPVVNAQKQIIGILSDRDLNRAMQTYDSGKSEIDGNETISKYMTTLIRTIPAESEISEVAQIMRDEKISSVLISENGLITGIITTDDLLSILVKVNQTDRDSFLHSATQWLYRKPIGEIAFRLAQIGI